MPGGVAGSGHGGGRNPTGMKGKHADIMDWSGLTDLIGGAGFGKFSAGNLDLATGFNKVLGALGLMDLNSSEFKEKGSGTGFVFTVSEEKPYGEYKIDTLKFMKSRGGNFANIKIQTRAEKDSLKSNNVPVEETNLMIRY